MTNKNKLKGTRLENRVVQDARKVGLAARKQPLSGALTDFPEDVQVYDLLGQCKAGYTSYLVGGGRTFSFSLEWLEGAMSSAKRSGYRGGVVFFRPDGSNNYYVCMNKDLFLDIISSMNVKKEENFGG